MQGYDYCCRLYARIIRQCNSVAEDTAGHGDIKVGPTGNPPPCWLFLTVPEAAARLLVDL